ncbi:MAG: SpoIID/LytB domain-containing protein [Ruminococcus sp.]
MNIQKPLKSVSVIIASLIMIAGANRLSKAETTLGTTDAILPATEVSSDFYESEEKETESESDWWKAEITDYDSSLSLISYEIIPETIQTTTSAESEMTSSTTTNVSSDSATDTNKSAEESQNDPSQVPYKSGSGSGETPVQQPLEIASPSSGEFAFTTYGWGHGVGLSQNGANAYATYAGWSYQDILFHYYQGTYLMNTGTTDGEIVSVNGETMDVLDAVAGIVYREVGGSMHEEAIKAQAVAVYTYIKFYGNDSHDLLCKPDPPQNVIDICRSVLGEALYYDGDFALTMFSASSGGYSANCYDVFSQDVPYLRSVYCEYDSVCDPHYGTVTYMTAEEVRRCIESDYGITLSDNPENWFAPYVGDSGYIYNVIIDGQIDVRGNDLRACLGLKSPKYDIAYAQ